MAFIMKAVKTVRNNWKKSVFGAVVLAYGASYTKNYIQTQNLMKVYCEKAVQYGNQTISVQYNPRTITVILNPNANKRKATKEFEKYCAPLLHLAGICVELIKTESEGHARSLMETLSGTEAIVVAGGDGTLSDVITGLLRRTSDRAEGLVPIGVIPLGVHNTLAKKLFPSDNSKNNIKSIVDATMAVIEDVTKSIDVMKIEILDKQQQKPVYAVSSIKWGAFRDAEEKKENYWYFGGLKKYVTYLFNGFKSNLTWNCDAVVKYSPPCEGCSNCSKAKTTENGTSGWLKKLIKETPDPKLSRLNPECMLNLEKPISTSDLSLQTSNAIPNQTNNFTVPKLQLCIGPDRLDYIEFVKQGWRSEMGERREIKETLAARTVEIIPKNTDSKNAWFSIDYENYEVRPVRVTLLPNIVKMYCNKDS